MGARQKMLDLIKASGWQLDLNETVIKSRYGREFVQNPHAFFKGAAHGGTWRIKLDYTNRSNSWSTTIDDTLRSVGVSYYNVLGEREPEGLWSTAANIGMVKRPASSRYSANTNPFYEGLGEGTLRQRAERLVKQPDLAVWLGLEAVENEKRLQAERNRRLAVQSHAEAQPLEITIGNGAHGYGSEYWRMANRLKVTAETLERAKGTSDLPLLLAEARRNLDDLVEVLTDEASLEYAEHLGES